MEVILCQHKVTLVVCCDAPQWHGINVKSFGLTVKGMHLHTAVTKHAWGSKRHIGHAPKVSMGFTSQKCLGHLGRGLGNIGPDPGRTNSYMHLGGAFKPRPGPTSPAQSGTPAAPGSRQDSAESAPCPCTSASAQPWGAYRAEEAHALP